MRGIPKAGEVKVGDRRPRACVAYLCFFASCEVVDPNALRSQSAMSAITRGFTDRCRVYERSRVVSTTGFIMRSGPS